MKIEIDFSKSIPGIHQAPHTFLLEKMPELTPVIKTFPDNPSDFTWDVKIHMLMPNQFPCIPNWHCDFVPRVNGVQRYDLVKPEYPMYLWLSSGPLTQFKHGFVQAQKWVRFNQLDEHRGIAASDFGWRCFIRATHTQIRPHQENPEKWERRHVQVYIDSNTYQW